MPVESFLAQARQFANAKKKSEILRWEQFLNSFRPSPDAADVCLSVMNHFPHDIVGIIAAQTLRDICKKPLCPRSKLIGDVVAVLAALLRNDHTGDFTVERNQPILQQVATSISILLADESIEQAGLNSVFDYSCFVVSCVTNLIDKLVSLHVAPWCIVQVLSCIPEHYPNRLPNLSQRSASRQAASVQAANCFLAATSVVVQFLDSLMMQQLQQPTHSVSAHHSFSPRQLSSGAAGLNLKVLACCPHWIKLALTVATDGGPEELKTVCSCLNMWHHSYTFSHLLAMLPLNASPRSAEDSSAATTGTAAEAMATTYGLLGECLCVFCDVIETAVPKIVAVKPPICEDYQLALLIGTWLERISKVVDMITNQLRVALSAAHIGAHFISSTAASTALMTSIGEALVALLRACRHVPLATASAVSLVGAAVCTTLQALHELSCMLAEAHTQYLFTTPVPIEHQVQLVKFCGDLALIDAEVHLEAALLVTGQGLPKRSAKGAGLASPSCPATPCTGGLTLRDIVREQMLTRVVGVGVFFSRFPCRLLAATGSAATGSATSYLVDSLLEELNDYRQSLRDLLRDLQAAAPSVGVLLIQSVDHAFQALQAEPSIVATGYAELEAALHALTAITKDPAMRRLLFDATAGCGSGSATPPVRFLMDVLSADLCVWSRPLCRVAVLLASDLLAVALQGPPELVGGGRIGVPADLVQRIAEQWRLVAAVSLLHAEEVALHFRVPMAASASPAGSTLENRLEQHIAAYVSAGRLPFRIKQDHIGAISVARTAPLLLRALAGHVHLRPLLWGDGGRLDESALLEACVHGVHRAHMVQRLTQAPVYVQGSLLHAMVLLCVPLCFVSQAHALPAHARALSWKSFSILFMSMSQLAVGAFFEASGRPTAGGIAEGLWGLYLPVLIALCEVTAERCASRIDRTALFAELAACIPTDSTFAGGDADTDALAVATYSQRGALAVYLTQTCSYDLLLSCALQLCSDASAALESLEYSAQGPQQARRRAEIVCAVASTALQAQLSLLASARVATSQLTPKQADLLLRTAAQQARTLTRSLRGAVCADEAAEVARRLSGVMQQYCAMVQLCVPFPHLRALAGASELLRDLETAARGCGGSFADAAGHLHQALADFCGAILQLGHRAVLQNPGPAPGSCPSSGTGARMGDQQTYTGLDLGLTRESDRDLELERENDRVDATLPAYLPCVVQVLRLTDLVSRTPPLLSFAQLPVGLLAALAEACASYVQRSLPSSEACRGCLELIQLLAGPVHVAGPGSTELGFDGLWDLKVAACEVAPMGHPQLVQAVGPAGLQQLVRGLVLLLGSDEHPDLRDPASKGLGWLCLAFGAVPTLQALLLTLVADMGLPADQAQRVCGALLSAALAGSWRKVRSQLRALAK